jgi:hypothetical protein
VGRNEEAELQARRTLELDSTYSAGHQELGFILLAEHRNAAALHEFERGIRLEGRQPYAGDLGILGYAYGVSGMGDHNRAFNAFQLSIDRGGVLLMDYSPNDPIFNPIRVDPRFSVLLSGVNLPPSGAAGRAMTMSSTRCTQLNINARRGSPTC